MTNLRYLLANWLKDKHGNDKYWAVSLESIGVTHNNEKDDGTILCYPTRLDKYVYGFVIYSDRIVEYPDLSKNYNYAIIIAADPNFLDKMWDILVRKRSYLNHMYNDGRDQYYKGYRPLNFDYPTLDIEIRRHNES